MGAEDRVEIPEFVPEGADTGISTRASVTVAVVLAVAAVAAIWAAAVGVGPALADDAALRDGIAARSAGLTAAAVTVTTLGNTFSMGVLAVVVGIVLAVRRRYGEAVFVVVTMATASLVFTLVKDVLARPRPPVATRLVDVTQESLPSGHATMSVAVLGSLVVLAWAGRGTAVRVAAVAAAALWAGAVGATRVYLGVHWFSDVLAGWLLGGAWLAICTSVWTWWGRRGAAVPPVDATE